MGNCEGLNVIYSDVTLEDLKGRNVLLCGFGYSQDLLKRILSDFGVIVKRDMSKVVEYIAFSEPYIRPNSKKNIAIIDAMKKKENKDDFPKFIDAMKLSVVAEQARRQLIRDKYKNETIDEKVARAKRIFDKTVMEIHKKMNETRKYNRPEIGACAGSFKRSNDTQVCEEGVDQFFSYVVEHYKEHIITDTCCDDPNVLRDNLHSAFKEVFLGGYLGEYVGVRLPIAVAIALFVFADASYSVSMDFVRDKWEGRGDYRSKSNVAFRLGPDYDEGDVFNT